MKKLTIGVIVFAVLIICGFIFYTSTQSGKFRAGPCGGFTEVGEFDQKIYSENDAKQIALNYYSSIGYEFNTEDLIVEKIDEGWLIRFSNFGYSRLDGLNLCHGSANPPECIGQELKLEEKSFGKNKILMEYSLDC